MKTFFRFVVACLMLSFWQKTNAAVELSPSARLHKLSMHVRGLPPMAQEQAELSLQTDPGSREKFFALKTDQYLKTREHAARMRFRLSELFQVRTPELQDLDVVDAAGAKRRQSTEFTGRDAMGKLFATLAEQNLSWDTLLTGKTYWLYEYPGIFNVPDPIFPGGDFAFLQALFREMSSPPLRAPPRSEHFNAPSFVEFSPNDERIAGAVTTNRFFVRYTTTNVNKNRRRAAAIYRIFLCDPMSAEVGGSTGDSKHEVIDDLFGDHFAVTSEDIDQIVQAQAVDSHGQDARCMACHYKLDPMGWTFQNIGVALNPTASPGQLVFERKGVGIVRESFKGPGGMAKAMVKQPEYVSCQTRWFWKEFIGKDVELSAARQAELDRAFEARGRRVNDFINYIVNQPEFFRRATAQDFPSIDTVKMVFRRCDGCHINEDSIPEFAVDQIGGSVDSHRDWLTKIRHALSLPDGDPKQMPKGLVRWTPEDRKTLESVKAWLAAGAPGPDGHKQIGVAP